MQTWVNLSGGTKWAFQLDGVIYRTSRCNRSFFAFIYSEVYRYFGWQHDRDYECE